MTEKKEFEASFADGFGKILGNLGELVEKLGDLAEKGESLKKSGDLKESDLKGVFGYTVNVGLGDVKSRVETFGNIRRDDTTGESVFDDVREPVVDIHEKDGYLLIVAELPGVSEENVKLDIKEKILTLTAAQGDKKYQRKIMLPKAFSSESITASCANGILEIRCQQ